MREREIADKGRGKRIFECYWHNMWTFFVFMTYQDRSVNLLWKEKYPRHVSLFVYFKLPSPVSSIVSLTKDLTYVESGDILSQRPTSLDSSTKIREKVEVLHCKDWARIRLEESSVWKADIIKIDPMRCFPESLPLRFVQGFRSDF